MVLCIHYLSLSHDTTLGQILLCSKEEEGDAHGDKAEVHTRRRAGFQLCSESKTFFVLDLETAKPVTKTLGVRFNLGVFGLKQPES